MVGLIGAMAVELEQLKAQMENLREEKIGMDVLYTGTLFGQEVVLAVCGPGKVNAALCAQSMILRPGGDPLRSRTAGKTPGSCRPCAGPAGPYGRNCHRGSIHLR